MRKPRTWKTFICVCGGGGVCVGVCVCVWGGAYVYASNEDTYMNFNLNTFWTYQKDGPRSSDIGTDFNIIKMG